MRQQGEEPELLVVTQLVPVVGFDGDTSVDRCNDDPVVISRRDSGARTEADRRVNRLRARVKEIERPDVERASREIDAGGSGGLDRHPRIIGLALIITSCPVRFVATSASY